MSTLHRQYQSRCIEPSPSSNFCTKTGNVSVGGDTLRTREFSQSTMRRAVIFFFLAFPPQQIERRPLGYNDARS
jgi:hypothetical protein